MRIGNHPTFTRVVFEFDAPAGYRLERRSEGEAENTIVITLDAGSRPRNITSHSPGVSSVSVEAGPGVAVARIVARESGMPIREMILADPPRVVFDLMLPARAVATVAPAASEPEPEFIEDPAPTGPLEAVQPPPDDGMLERTSGKPAPAPVERMVEPEPVVEELAAEAATEIPAPEVVEDIDLVESIEELVAAEDAAVEPEATPPSPDDEAAALAAEFLDSGDSEPEAPAVEPYFEAEETPSRAASLPAAPAPEPSRLDYVTMGAIAGGAIALLGVVFLVVRGRRSIPNDLDVTALAVEDDPADAERLPQGGFAEDAPVDGISDAAQGFEFGSSDEPSDENKPIESISAPEVGSGLFDQAPEEGEATTMDHQELTNMGTESEASTHLAAGAAFGEGGGDSDVARLVQELEQRVSKMETRLDEANDARERLERQVAAQSEELRVQRAAIARTQRALRSLNRSEDDQATEPALREPSSPDGDR